MNSIFSLRAHAARILLHRHNFSRCGAARKPVVGHRAQHLSGSEFTDSRTFRTRAGAACARAKIPRDCSTPFAALQPFSPKRSLKPAKMRQIHTDHSLRAARTGRERTDPPFAHAAIAEAASVRIRSGDPAAQQHRSPKRSFPSGFRGIVLTAPSLYGSRTRKTRTERSSASVEFITAVSRKRT